MKTNTFVAAYARYSTDNQTENSIAFQFESIEKYCKTNSLNIIRYYKDEAKSGTNTNRIGFTQLLRDAKEHLFSKVVIYDVSRGSRDVVDWFMFRKEMMKLDIEIVSVHDKLGDMLDPGDFLTELVTVGVGQHHVLQSRQKSIEGTTKRAQEGLFLGGCPPFGYDIIQQHYVINPYEAEIVEKIFTLYATGSSYSEILDAIGHDVMGKKGRPLGKNTIYAILRNERYIGIYTWNKRRIKTLGKWAGGGENENKVEIRDMIPKIIDQDMWNTVQNRLKTNKGGTYKAKRKYLLSGLIHCDTCGAMYCGRTSVNQRGHQNAYYVCGNKTRTRSCDSKNIKASDIEEFVKQTVKDFLTSMDLDMVARNIVDDVNKEVIDRSNEKLELVEIAAKIKNITKAIMNGISYPELMEDMNKLQKRKHELEEILNLEQYEEINKASADSMKKFLSYLIENVDDNIEQVIKGFVVRINAHHDGSYTVVLGVAHTSSSGSPQYAVCAIVEHPAA